MKIFHFLLLLLLANQTPAQIIFETPAPNYIRSIQLQGNSPITGTPVIQLGEPLVLEFDDIIGDEADYYYTVDHFDYNWTPSALAKTEYLNGFDNVRIFNYTNSTNTLQPYTHYELIIPNNDLQGLKVTGNYLLSIFNREKELVFSRKFMVYQPIAQVRTAIKRSRDLQFANSKQIVNFSIFSPDLLLQNPSQTVKVLVMQNYNLNTAILGLEPQYTLGNEIIYRYDQPLAFWAGNEFLKFDSKDLRAPTVNISRIELIDLYHHYLFVDRSRDEEPYTYNPDINGQFVIRALQGNVPDVEAEYVWTHFSLLNYEPLRGGELHLYGAFNNFNLDETTRMIYNPETGLFENARLFKQGYYDYKYVLLLPDGSIDSGFISGNFVQTENDYQVLVYYRDIGARYDRIIGYGNASSIDISY